MSKVITIGEQRFYPYEDRWLPSVTTIIDSCYPKSKFLIDWQIEKGKEESERIKNEAAQDGTFIHERIEWLIKGLAVEVDGLTAKQAKCIKAFIDWANDVQPTFLGTEIKAYNLEKGYAGTIDILAEIDGEPYIIDIKTSNYIHDSYTAQVGAYAEAYSSYMTGSEQLKAGILHINARTKKGWSFKEVDVQGGARMFDLCRQMFYHLYPDASPKQIEYPDLLQLNNKKNEIK